MKEASQFFKVLSDPARLQMLWLLFEHRELCVCDIMEALEIPQSKASRHLAALRNAGLVKDRKEGQWSYYSLQPAADPFTKEHLKLLRKSLATLPEADVLLSKLEKWVTAKRCDGMDNNESAGLSPVKKRGVRKPRVSGRRGA
jgi:ArsR family transcriptional regulator, arsenate/arsenite/antimonite-responsive transcriptional repressor